MASAVYPFEGKFKVTSVYGNRQKPTEGASSNHIGVDLASQVSSTAPVRAISASTVSKVGYSNARGNYIFAYTEDGFGMVYQHLSRVLVKQGQKVAMGEVIGNQGNTGVGTGPHLHLEVHTTTNASSAMGAHRFANAINPFQYFGMPTLPKTGSILEGSPVTVSNVASDFQDENSVLKWMTASGEHYKTTDLKGAYHDILFGRRYKIILELDNGQFVDLSTLRCTFDITKSWYNPDNCCVVSVYNLNATHENMVIKHGRRIIVEAGYSGETFGLIYSGNVFQVLRSKENGTDYILTILAYDSPSYSLYNVTNTTLISQATMRQAVNAVTKAIDKGQISAKTTEINYPRGKVLFGGSASLLNQIKKTIDSTYYIENGKINIIDAETLEPGEVFDLGPKSGLIGSPSQTQEGITCKCLINPRIKLNSLFHVDNSKIATAQVQLGQYQVPLDAEGLYRVIKLNHVGDTRGQDWYTTITAITQNGSLPSLADNYGTIIN